ncbi:MAG: hypothetical protein U5L09_00050 [Bacteroidales bacterium]|nr:hypothetical protein [Bacteroidales bacterium]
MKTVNVELRSKNALRLLKELERTNIIRVLDKDKNKKNASSLRGKLNLSEAQYSNFQEYAKKSRDEWEQNT